MYLWKDKRLHLRITRLGIQYLIAMVVVGMSGAYTNNNLLHAVFGLMVGILLVSGWLSRSSLKSIKPIGIEEGTLFAKLKGGLRLRLSDSAPKRVRALGLHLEIPNCKVMPVFLPGGKGDGEPLANLPVRPEMRGTAKVRCIEMRTSYPFGFLEKNWRFHVDMPFLVCPHPAGHDAPKGGSGEYSEPSPKAGHSSPIGARPFVQGDSTNRIHWKRMAQSGEPWVRVLEGDQPRGLALELDLGEWEAGQDFECELERLSGTILHARLQKLDVTLVIFGRNGRIDQRGHIAAWRALALAEAEKKATDAESLI